MQQQNGSPIVIIPILLLVVIVLGLGSLYMRRKGYSASGGRVVVRCRQGHLFTTLWIPGGSFKAVRLGWARFQHCPVGNHWTLVVPVRESDLTAEEKRFAATHRDSNIP